jgi:uncharacterized membrane protein YsdA (DUF1294 family)
MGIKILWTYIATINAVALILCLYDKRAAIKKRSRISEKKLFLVSFIGGAAGMFTGMLTARHKTRHWYFTFFIPLITAMHVLLLIWLL